MKGWHSSVLAEDGFDELRQRLLLQTGPSLTWSLNQHPSTAFISTANEQLGETVQW